MKKQVRAGMNKNDLEKYTLLFLDVALAAALIFQLITTGYMDTQAVWYAGALLTATVARKGLKYNYVSKTTSDCDKDDIAPI